MTKYIVLIMLLAHTLSAMENELSVEELLEAFTNSGTTLADHQNNNDTATPTNIPPSNSLPPFVSEWKVCSTAQLSDEPANAFYTVECSQCNSKVITLFPLKVQHAKFCTHTQKEGWNITEPTFFYDVEAICPFYGTQMKNNELCKLLLQESATLTQVNRMNERLKMHCTTYHAQESPDNKKLKEFVRFKHNPTIVSIPKTNNKKRRTRKALQKLMEEKYSNKKLKTTQESKQEMEDQS